MLRRAATCPPWSARSPSRVRADRGDASCRRRARASSARTISRTSTASCRRRAAVSRVPAPVLRRRGGVLRDAPDDGIARAPSTSCRSIRTPTWSRPCRRPPPGCAQARSSMLFPEGERDDRRHGASRSAKGAAILAAQLEVPIVPAALDGSVRPVAARPARSTGAAAALAARRRRERRVRRAAAPSRRGRTRRRARPPADRRVGAARARSATRTVGAAPAPMADSQYPSPGRSCAPDGGSVMRAVRQHVRRS